MKDTFDVHAWNKSRYLNESQEPGQTAVEWLFEQYKLIDMLTTAQIEKAKEMEKEQMGDTWVDSRIADKGDDYIGKQKSFEEYYQETYGK